MKDFTGKGAQVKDNAVNALETAKNTMVVMQRGQSVITAVKTAIKNAPGTPAPLASLMDTAYGDMVVGLILHTAAPVFTGNKLIMDAVKDANVAGTVVVSQQFTFLQDTIEQAILAIPGFASTAMDKLADEAFGVKCPKCEGVFPPDKIKEGFCNACYNATDPEDING